MYDEAVANGYNGDFFEFISEFFASSLDEAYASTINKGLFTTCNIKCPYTATSVLGGSDTYSSGGAGVFYSVNKEAGDALIITNYHVLYRSGSSNENKINEIINVYLYGDSYFKTPISAQYVGGSATYDLALIKITGSEEIKNSYAVAANFVDSDSIKLGQSVLAIGNPGTDGTSVTKGVINVISEYINLDNAYGDDVSMRVIRHDVAVNPGNSGGGLFDMEGGFLGIVNAKLVEDDFENIGYAIPSNLVKLVVENIIENCLGKANEKVRKAVMGVTVQVKYSTTVYDKDTETITVTDTIEVSEILSTSQLKAYFRTGDIINSVTLLGKTHAVKHMYDLTELMLTIHAGDLISFNVTRSGEEKIISFALPTSCMTYID